MDKPKLDSTVKYDHPSKTNLRVMTVADTYEDRGACRVLCHYTDHGIDKYQWFECHELMPAKKRKKP